jgi:hypothetical protein
MAPHRPHFENSSGSPWTILWTTVDASTCSQIGQAAKLSNRHSRTGRAPHVRSPIGVGTSRAVTGDIPAKTFSRGRAFRGCVKMSTDWPDQSFRTSMPNMDTLHSALPGCLVALRVSSFNSAANRSPDTDYIQIWSPLELIASHNPRCCLRQDTLAEDRQQNGKHQPIRCCGGQGNGRRFGKLDCDVHTVTLLLGIPST